MLKGYLLRIWSLNMGNLVWKRLSPAGTPPLSCDKTTLWAYQDKVYNRMSRIPRQGIQQGV